MYKNERHRQQSIHQCVNTTRGSLTRTGPVDEGALDFPREDAPEVGPAGRLLDGGQGTTLWGRATTSLPRKNEDTALYARDMREEDSGWNSNASPYNFGCHRGQEHNRQQPGHAMNHQINHSQSNSSSSSSSTTTTFEFHKSRRGHDCTLRIHTHPCQDSTRTLVSRVNFTLTPVFRASPALAWRLMVYARPPPLLDWAARPSVPFTASRPTNSPSSTLNTRSRGTDAHRKQSDRQSDR